MGWFDEQIKTRISNDREEFENSFLNLSSVVLGEGIIAAALNDDRIKTRNAIEEILRYYHVKPTALPDSLTDMNDILEYLLRPSGIMRRTVNLKGKWYKDGIGALLAQTTEGDVVALIPDALSGYTFLDYADGKRKRVTKKNCGQIAEEAICFYLPLPLKKIGLTELVMYIFGSLSRSDYVMIAAATLAASLIGMLTPYATNLIYSQVIPSGDRSLLLPIFMLLLGVTVSTALINITKSLIMSRINTKTDCAISSASMSRVLGLPTSFFKRFSSGELSSRISSLNSLCQMLTEAVLQTSLSSAFSLIYISQIFQYAPALVVPALIVILLSLGCSVISVMAQISNSRAQMKESAALSGVTFGLFSGIQKIKLSGAERRAFSKWAQSYQKQAKLRYAPEFMIKFAPLLTTAILMLGTIIFYYAAFASETNVADYMAFNAAFGMISGGMMSLASIAYTVAQIGPTLEMAEPILSEIPEVSTEKKMVDRISGSIELNNVTFRYGPDLPTIIDNLSLKIRPGQYIAIVGKTGCGKSTLMRIMLGFEKPQKGAVFYDGMDMDKLDLKSLRRQMGVVMQNGKLFSGDLYSNITVSAPWLTMEQAEEAARDAGMEDDIANMPMGMHTIISEGGGGISGGQRQRIMIARAIAPKPKILMFDEATSALDNITQKQVSASLDHLKCTRIVIAHRLSTIRQCDRIIVLERGKIVEDGTYDELNKAGGFFSELVARQQIDKKD